MNSILIDDSSSNVTYVPVDQWTVHTDVALSFGLYNNTDTFSSVQNATATVIFYGNSIEYWGNQGPFHGPCAISLDGQQVATANSNAAADDVPILLYSKSNLTLGDHTLEIRVVDASFPNVCEVDRFVTNITSTSLPSSNSPTPSQTTTTTGNFAVPVTTRSGGITSSAGNTSVVQPTSGGDNVGNNGAHSAEKKSITPLGAIVGAVIGGGLVFLLLALYMCIRSRKRKEKRRNIDITISKPFVLDDEHSASSPGPRSPSLYQTERDRMSSTASPEDRPPSTPQTATRLPAKLMAQARPCPAAFDAAQSQSDSGGYGYQYQYEHQSGSHFTSASPITEETHWQSGMGTFSPTDADADAEKLGYEFSSPKSRGLYAVNRSGTSTFGSERQSGNSRSSAGRNDVPPPAYDEFGNDSISK